MKHNKIQLTLACFLAFSIIAPLLMVLTVSLNPDKNQIMIDLGTWKAFIPLHFSFHNYSTILTDETQPFLRFFGNTIFIVVTTLVFSLLVNTSAAFALAFGHGKYRKILVLLIIAIYIVPAESLMMPLLVIINKLGWVNSYQAMIIPMIANPFSIFLYYQFFVKIPKELVDAAKVDGANLITIFYKIILPLSLPIISTAMILEFLGIWNSYLWPSIITRGPSHQPLAVAMASYFGSNNAEWGNIMAFAILMALPAILVFLVFQRWFVKSLMASGVKG